MATTRRYHHGCLLLALLVHLLCSPLVSPPLRAAGLAWDRLPYRPAARSGLTLVALPLSWAFPNASARVAREFFSTLPPDAPPLHVSSLLLSFGGETNAGPVADLFALPYPPSLLPQSRLVYVRPVPTGVSPLARLQHVAAVVPNRMSRSLRPTHVHYTKGWMCVFGGADTRREMNSLWLYDLNINQWIGLGPYPSQEAQANAAPLPKGASLIDLGVPLDESMREGRMESYSDDWQGCIWPNARSLSAMVLMEIDDSSTGAGAGAGADAGSSSSSMHLFLHGGHFQGVWAGTIHVWGDLWSLRVDDADFFTVLNTQVQSADGSFVANVSHPGPCVPWRMLHASNASALDPSAFPAPRYGHAIAGVNDEAAIYLFGGASSALFEKFYADLWRYDVRSNRWAEIVASVAPAASQRPSAPMTTMAPRSDGVSSSLRATDPSESDPSCPDGVGGWMLPIARCYHSLFVVDDQLYLYMGAQDLLTPQPYSFTFNLTKLRAQNPTLQGQRVPDQRRLAPEKEPHPLNLTCVNCWLGLNSSLLQDASVPPLEMQVLRGSGPAMPLLVNTTTGRTDLVIYGGIPATDEASREIYVVSVDPSRRSALCPALLAQHVGVSLLPQSPLPYYANIATPPPCTNETQATRPSSPSSHGGRSPSRAGGPPARSYHSGAGYNDVSYFFGGSTGLGQNLDAHDDLWSYALVEDRWTALGEGDGTGRRAGFPDQPWPHARISPSIQLWMRPAPPGGGADAPTLLMMGGGTVGSEFYNDVWLYDIATGTWSEQECQVKGSVPLRGRYAHFGAITDGRFYCFGGAVVRTDDHLVTNELWTLDLATWEWTLLFAETPDAGAWPAPRFGHAGALIPAVITAEWSGEAERANPTQLLVGLGGSFAQVLGDWWLFDIPSHTWQPLVAPGDAPSYRFFPVNTLLHNRLYVFGGFDTSARNDMYELDLHARSWKALDTPKLLSGSVPPARTGCPGVALPRLSKMLVFSGQTEGGNDLHVFTVDAPRLHQVADDAADAAADEPEVVGHDVLALFVPYVRLPPDPQTPLLSFATLAASVNYFQSEQAGYVQYFISGAPATDNPGQQAYSPFTRRLSTVTLSSPSLLRGVLRGASGPAPADRFPLLDCGAAECFRVETSDRTHAVEFESLHLRRARSDAGAAFSVQRSAVALRFVTLDGHTAERRGAALSANASAVLLQSCLVRGCVAGSMGGAVFVAASDLAVVNCTFDSNAVRLQLDGSGDAPAVSTTHNGSDASGAAAEGFGGAIFALASTLTVRSSNFTNNSVWEGRGGAIAAVSISAAVAGAADLLGETATLTIEGSNFEANSAVRGGAVFQSAFVQPMGTPADSSHSASVADAHTAQLLSSYCNNSFVSNSATLSGGALYLSECTGVRMSGGRLQGNRADPAAGGGGGLYWEPNMATLADRRRLTAAAPLLSGVSMGGNAAAYGADLASSAVELRLDDGSAVDRHQVSGALLVPPPRLSLRDYWGQRLLTDNSTFVSAQPSSLLSGDSVVQVERGSVLFSKLRLMQTPTRSASISFIASVTLPLLAEAAAAGNLTLNLTSAVCMPGQFLPGGMHDDGSSNSQVCQDCSPGSYNDNSLDAMLGICHPCAPGSYQNASRSTSCARCRAGTFSPSSGLASSSGCPDCPSGSFAFNEGAASCQRCDAGVHCENRRAYALQGRWLVVETIQAPESGPGVDSGVGGDGGGGGGNSSTTGRLISAVYSVSCPGENCAEGGVCGSNRLNPPSINVLCGACESDSYTQLNGRCSPCPGPNYPLIFLLLLLGFVLVLVLHRLASGGSSNADLQILSYFAQSVLFQCGGAHLSSALAWMSVFNLSPKRLIGGGGGGGLCLFPMSAYGELAIDLFTPLALGAMLLSIMGAHWCIGRRLNRGGWLASTALGRALPRWVEDKTRVADRAGPFVRRRRSTAERRNVMPLDDLTVSLASHGHADEPRVPRSASAVVSSSHAERNGPVLGSSPSSSSGGGNGVDPVGWTIAPVSSKDAYIRTATSLLLFVYQPLSSVILNHLNCVSVGNGARAVFVAPTMDCTSRAYRAWMVALVAGVVVVVAGAPIVLAVCLYKHRRLIRPSDEDRAEQAEIASRHSSTSAAVVSPPPPSSYSLSASLFSRRWGVLFQAYSLRHRLGYMYQLVILLRRLLFVVLDVALFLHPTARMVCFALANLAVFHVHLALQPYHQPTHNRMESATLLSLSLVSVLLIPQATNETDTELPTSLRVLLSLLILPLTILLVAKLLATSWRRYCGKRCRRAMDRLGHVLSASPLGLGFGPPGPGRPRTGFEADSADADGPEDELEEVGDDDAEEEEERQVAQQAAAWQEQARALAERRNSANRRSSVQGSYSPPSSSPRSHAESANAADVVPASAPPSLFIQLNPLHTQL